MSTFNIQSMKKFFLLPIALFAFVSCSDDEGGYVEPIVPISEGGLFGTAEYPLNVGGSNQPNHVFVDLSSQATVTAPRDSWDLAFYCGNDFKIAINGAVMVAGKQLETTDITLPQVADPVVSVGTTEGSDAYIDHPNGSLDQTLFGNLATSGAAAHVYLINLGYSVPTVPAENGSVNTTGTPRGWKKVKIWADGSGYRLQYADLDATVATEVSIIKDPAYNYVFFSLINGATVQVEPEKAAWDLNFTTFTNITYLGSDSYAYFYSDFVASNTKAGVVGVKVDGAAADYESFTKATFDAGNYTLSTDQRVIGSDWRDVFTHTTFENVFFVIRDTEGNLYKIRFIAMLSANGERGFPSFQYALLQ
jgi:hypothetical protein